MNEESMTEREAFENFIIENNMILDGYDTRFAWKAWQAARAPLMEEVKALRSVVSNHRLRHYKEHSTGWDWGMVDAQELIDAVPKTEETK